MKRSLSLLLVLTLAFSMLPSALAADITASGTQSSNTQVTYGISESYIVTVPEAATMGTDGRGSLTISVSNAMLASNGILNVYITGDSYVNEAWHLTNTAESSSQLPYTITKDATNVAPNDVVLTVAAGSAWNATVSQLLNLVLTEEVSKAGTYTDQLTFVVEYNDGTNVTLEKNEYGFYYAQPYHTSFWRNGTIYADGEIDIICYDDNTVIVWTISNAIVYDNAVYDDNSISFAGTTLNVLDDGKTLRAYNNVDEDGAFTLTPIVEKKPAAGQYQVQYSATSMVGIPMVEYEPGVKYNFYEDAELQSSQSLSGATVAEGRITAGDFVTVYHPDGQRIGYKTNSNIFLAALKVSNTGELSDLFPFYYDKLYAGYDNDYNQVGIALHKDNTVTIYRYLKDETANIDDWIAAGHGSLDELGVSSIDIACAPYGFYLDGQKIMLLPDILSPQLHDMYFGTYRYTEDNITVEAVINQNEFSLTLSDGSDFMSVYYKDGYVTVHEDGGVNTVEGAYTVQPNGISLGINAVDDFAIIALATADGESVILVCPGGTFVLELVK